VGHVALVVFENQQEDKIFGNPHMPWLNQLAQQNAYAANYFADVHPSLGDYFFLTTGQVVSNDLSFDQTVDVDNVIRQVLHAGKTWKAYEESIPSVGYLGDGPLPYVKTHNPAAYLSDVRNDPAQAANMVPLDQLSTDLAAGNLPNLMFVEPNQINSMHDCPEDQPTCGNGNPRTNDTKLSTGDQWAQQHLGALLSNPTFQQDGLLIITWDESWGSDFRHGGGHVLTILVGPKVKKGFVSNTFYQHESVLKLISDALQLPEPGAAATAPSMSEFFNGL
jgi:acid phosphatase